MSAYDRQLIVAFAAGPDATVARQAAALAEKHRELPLPTEVLLVPEAGDGRGLPTAALADALAGRRQVSLPMGMNSRLYLVGNGDWRARTLGGWNPPQLAAWLAAGGLGGLRTVSIVADALGRDRGGTDAAPLTEAMDSFAASLHRSLLATAGITTVLHARVGPVVVAGADGATPAVGRGRKLTAGPAGTPGGLAVVHHRPQSKLRFHWDGGVQRREWAY